MRINRTIIYILLGENSADSLPSIIIYHSLFSTHLLFLIDRKTFKLIQSNDRLYKARLRCDLTFKVWILLDLYLQPLNI